MLQLTDVEIEYVKEFKSFTNNNVVPHANQFDKTERLSEQVIQKLKESGYLGSMIPKEYGGLGLSQVAIGLLNREIGRGCSSLRSLLTVHGMVALSILRWGTAEQKSYYLPKMASGEILAAFALSEPEVGSDANAIQCTADLSEDKYVINGCKKWTTMAQIADIILVVAKCNDKVTAFIVEANTKGLSINKVNGLIGLKASMMAELCFNDCCVPQDNIIGKIGMGLSHVALSGLDYGRYTVAWGCVGMSKICLEKSIHYSKKRKQFGEPIRKHELIQKMITEMVVQTQAAELMCYNAGNLKDKGNTDSIMSVWHAKYLASKTANLVSGYAIQVMGANGCMESNSVERFYRDAKIMEIIEGSSQIHEILIANNAYVGDKVYR